ncbi:MAG: CRISPR-associated helicase Cas3' [Chloroflexota bacterium]|nr:CRISPR-associated helicase Cas3' [Chloroflexota bacterium]
MATEDVLLEVWAKKKTDSGGAEIRYPLLYHMLDVAVVALAVWQSCLQSGARHFCAEQLGVDEMEARRLISCWAGLHDIGKASPGFQCQDEATKLQLKNSGFDISGTRDHGTVTAALLRVFLRDTIEPDLARKVATAVGGHHGVFPRSEQVNKAQAGTRLWPVAQKGLYDTFCGLCRLDSSLPPTASPAPAFFMFLAGLTSVSDWIASNETFFPIDHAQDASLEAHVAYAWDQAEVALKELFWEGWQPASAMADFKHLFSFEERPLQSDAVNLACAMSDRPGLVIIEAPTGEGKTEAAMYLADSWAVGIGQKGCYFALPTMATSDQMFGRVRSYLENRYRDQTVNLMLLHGHAALSAEFESHLKRFDAHGVSGDDGYDGVGAGVIASEWFTYRKRGLLAPFGVGTIDQILLAVLQTRHVFVRLFGLAGKTVIIDEVHAYDTYMTSLLERLLEWLAALGSSVVMLSATLPRLRKDALLKAYAKGLGQIGEDVPAEVSKVCYPRISWTDGGAFYAKSVGRTSQEGTKELRLRWVNGDLPQDGGEFELGDQLQEALSNGGCAAVICNTVDKAQQVYLALKPHFPGMADDGGPVLDLLHARYLFGDRRERENRCLVRFGKPGATVHSDDGDREVRRPGKAVLVATQVIEQSLDLDFDLMVTEMAPVDLLLQRAGRLHRHQRTPEERQGLVEPALWVCWPQITAEVPDFGGGTQAVYDYHVLLRSWLAIKDRLAIRIPGEVEDLIEAVYGKWECPDDLPQELKGVLVCSKAKHDDDMERERREAEDRWIKWPGFNGELWRITYETKEEDEPSLHKSHQALTRLAGLNVNVLCLYGSESLAFMDKRRTQPVDFGACPTLEMARRLLKHSISISRRDLVETMVGGDGYRIPRIWREAAPLRHHYILFFDEQSLCCFDQFEISLDDELGLTIARVA